MNRSSAPRPPRSRKSTGVEWVSSRRRRRRWPRLMPAITLRRRPIVQPISSAEQDFVRRPAFYVRVGVLGLVVATLFGILLLRLWSLQVIQGARFAHAARAQSFRTVYLPTSRGSIVDRSRRMLVGTTGQLAITADAASLGETGAKGRWRPTRASRAELRHLARL